MTPNPDRWDEIIEDPHRLGAHSADFRTPPESIAPVLIAGVLALIVGLFCAVALPLMGVLPKASQTHSALSSPNTISLSGAVPQQSQTPSTQTQTKLRRTPVSIYNATDDQNRTTEFSSELGTRGWVIGEMGLWGAQDPGRTTVFYGKASQKAAAQLLSADLNGAQIKQDSSVGDSLLVVISAGYQAG